MQRKTTFVLVVILAVMLTLFATFLVASAEKGDPPAGPQPSLSLSPLTLSPTEATRFGPAEAPDALINDGSFENGPPPGSAWTEVTNSTCEWIGDWSGVWGVAAHDGSIDFWAGGYCGGTPTTSSVSQAGLAVPATDNDLHFWYMTYRPDLDDGDNDRAYVNVNGTPVWNLPLIQANDTYPNWVEVVVPMGAYAGQNVTLEFGGISEGASTGNIRFDYISFGAPPPPPPRCPVGSTEVTVLTQDFEGAFPPAGWAVADNGGSCTNPGAPTTWVNTDPGGKGNLTGGAGAFAMADSDYCGSGSYMDTELWTPAIDLTGLTDPEVAFNLDYFVFSGSEYAALDASTDNGATWGNVHTWTASARGPRLYETAIPGAGDNDVRVRWHYGNANWDWWWEVDEVVVTACEPDSTPSIELVKTVGTVPGVCAATDDITVTAGTEVYYCYQVENTGDVTFEFHDLVDSELGTLLDQLPYTLAPGAFSPQVIVPDTPMASVTNSATWTAVNALAGYGVDDTIAYDFQDISGTGTAFTLGDDAVSAALPIGFDFDFFGTGYSSAYASSNGFMTFNNDTNSGCCTGQPMPTAGSPDNMIAGWWEDLDPGEAGAGLYYQTLGSAPNRVFIVQFSNVQHYPSGNPVTMQYKLFEGSNVVEVHYTAAPSDGGTHSAGIENVDGTVGVQYYLGTSALTTPLAVQYAPMAVESASDSDTATVTVLTPNIDVDPLSMESTQPVDVTTSQPMTVTNTGTGDLVWNIAEEPTAAPAAPTGGGNEALALDVVDPSDFKGSQPAGAAPELSSWHAPDAVLYDNGPLVTHPGGGAGGADASALQTALLMSTYGFGYQVTAGNRVADDFTVPGSGWLISDITFFGYQTGSSTTSTFTSMNLRIWDGPPDNAGSSVVFGDTTTNRLTASTWSNIYRVLDTDLTNTDRPVMANVVAVNTFLPAGTYWLDWQADGTLGSGPWAPPISVLGQTTTGNALQWTGAWAPLIDTGSGTVQGLPFIIEGLTDCSNLADVPWLSVSPDNGVNTGGTSTVATVGFDSTGLANGSYTANLCISSNDPDPGPGNGTDLVIVPVTLTVQAAPSIELVKTVGTTPGVCATTSSIEVPAGTTVYYCYEVTNTGDVTLNLHDLVDDQLGTIFSGLNYALTPGSSVNTVAAGLSIPAVVNVPTTNVATWTAYNAGGSSASAIATAHVDVLYMYCNMPNESFESGVPPMGWTVVNNVAGGVSWGDIAACDPSGNGGNWTGGAGNAACMSPGTLEPPQAYDAELRSPPFSLVGQSAASASYLVNYQSWAGNDRLNLDISADGGATWTTLKSWNDDHGAFQSLPGESVWVNLTPWVGQSNLILRWHYFWNDPQAIGWYAQVDNVGIDCTELPPTAVTLNDLSIKSAQMPAPLASLPLAALPAAAAAAAAVGAAFVWRRRRD